MNARTAVPAVFLSIFLAAAPVAASAYSGPEYWESTPAFSVTPLKGSPITVEREDLTFDFSKNKSFRYSPSADVSAAYRMKNPTGEAVRIQMAFPLIARLSDIVPAGNSGSGTPGVGNTLAISVDGKTIPFEILPGSEMPKAGISQNYYAERGRVVKASLPNLEKILQSISQRSQLRKIVTGSGQRYLITMEQDGGVQVQTTGKSTYLLSRGFNGTESSGTNVTLTCSSMKKGDSVSIFTLGGKPVITPLSSGGTPSPAEKLRIRTTTCPVDSYVREMLTGSRTFPANRSQSLLARLVSRAEDRMESSFAAGNHAFGDSDFYDFLQQERLFVLCFEADFPAGAERAVTVRYAMSGAMDTRQAEGPVYSYAYLLNPAKGWAGFKDLNIRITPPSKAPNLVASSLSFTKSPGGVYTASLPSLPKNDLTFSFYKDASLTPKQSEVHGFVIFLLCAVAFVAALWLFVFLCQKRKQKNSE